MTLSLARRAAVEALGTALLLAAVVGSGIMGESLAQGNVAIALLANSIATGAALTALILALGPLSPARRPALRRRTSARRDAGRAGGRVDRRHPPEGSCAMKTYLFACVHNAGRSQMAAAWLEHLADPAEARAISAGTQPGTRVHPEVASAMREVGIELEGRLPQRLTDELAAGATMLITMGCGDECPVVPGVRRDDWPLVDPKGKSIEEVRQIRDDVRARVEALISSENVALREGAR